MLHLSECGITTHEPVWSHGGHAEWGEEWGENIVPRLDFVVGYVASVGICDLDATSIEYREQLLGEGSCLCVCMVAHDFDDA